ncbi:hypothetical protein PGTUg99_024627, partial [Puccinia graminis f. sp. tritici]
IYASLTASSPRLHLIKQHNRFEHLLLRHLACSRSIHISIGIIYSFINPNLYSTIDPDLNVIFTSIDLVRYILITSIDSKLYSFNRSIDPCL